MTPGDLTDRPAAVLRLGLELEGPGPAEVAVCRLQVHGRDQFVARAPVGSFAPAGGDSLNLPEDDLVAPVRQALANALAPGDPLWLEFESPCGDLPVRPWEAVLVPALERPVLRLAYTPFQPLANPDPLDVVLIASSPAAKDPLPIPTYVDRVARSVLRARADAVTVHLFADQKFYEALRSLLLDVASDGERPGVRVYDPAGARVFAVADRVEGIEDRAGVLASPWLRWVCGSLPDDRAADVVHFVGHGYRSADRGALAVAASPLSDTDRQWARFVGPSQLASFLTQLGAWSVALGTPAGGAWSSGLRLLADNLARVVAGPVICHELTDVVPAGQDAPDAAVAGVYALLTRPGHAPVPASRWLLLYTRPEQIAGPVLETAAPFTVPVFAGTKGLVAMTKPSGELTVASGRPPRWVAASQRVLEQTAAELSRGAASAENPEARRRGMQDAVRLVSTLVRANAAPTGVAESHLRTGAALLQIADTLGAAGDEAERAVVRLASGPDGAAAAAAARSLGRYARAVSDALRMAANVRVRKDLPDDAVATLDGVLAQIGEHADRVERLNQWVARLAAALLNLDLTRLPGLAGRALRALAGTLAALRRRIASSLAQGDPAGYRSLLEESLWRIVLAASRLPTKLPAEAVEIAAESRRILVGLREVAARFAASSASARRG